MNRIHRSSPVPASLAALALLVALTAGSLAAQAPPPPAPELKKLESLVGTWNGAGAMNEPAGVTTKWTAVGTYGWCLDGQFLQEDFQIAFEGMPAPLTFRGYVGWDREHKRYVVATVNNGGEAQLHECHFLPDGTQLQMMLQNQEGLPYAERSLFKVDGDTLTHTIDLLMSSGKSMTIVDGKFTRGGKAFAGAFDGATWMGAKPNDAITKLVRSAGVYDVTGTMVPMPGAPAMKIKGTDTFRSVFGGTVLHGRTEGEAEGMPCKYVGDVFWAFDARQQCLTGIYVSNFGEVMQMHSRWTADGKLLTTSSMMLMGEPAVQRMVMEFDDKGAAKAAVSHSIVGLADPFVSFRASYTKKS